MEILIPKRIPGTSFLTHYEEFDLPSLYAARYFSAALFFRNAWIDFTPMSSA